MPSFLDTLQSSDDEPGGDAPLDVLTSVKAEGARRRRSRHRRNAALSGLALALVAVPAFAALGGSGGGEDVRSTDLAGATDDGGDRESGAADVERTTTSTTAPTEVLGVQITQVPEAPVEEVAPTPTTARPPRTTVPPPTAPPLVCENSYDPACGEFSWSPAPAANQPLTLSVPAGLAGAPGASVRVDVTWSDPDAPLGWHLVDPNAWIGSGCALERKFGPWTPPAPAGGSGSFSFDHLVPADAQPGSTITLYLSAGSATTGECDDPYRSDAQALVQITVAQP